MAYCIAVLYAEHDGSPAFGLQSAQVGRGSCQAYGVTVLFRQLPDALQLAFGVGRRCGKAVGRALALRNVGDHDAGIQSSFGHLVQVNKDARVALVEVDVLVEKHRRVAMAVQREDTAVQAASLSIVGSFVGEPVEKGHHRLVATQAETLGMPLHAEDALML